MAVAAEEFGWQWQPKREGRSGGWGERGGETGGERVWNWEAAGEIKKMRGKQCEEQ